MADSSARVPDGIDGLIARLRDRGGWLARLAPCDLSSLQEDATLMAAAADALTALRAERDRLAQEKADIRAALDNVRLAASRGLAYGHQATPHSLDRLVQVKEAMLRDILRFCDDVGIHGSILRNARERAENAAAEVAQLAQEKAEAERELKDGHTRLDETRAKDTPGPICERISWLINLLTWERSEAQHQLAADDAERDAVAANLRAAEHRRCAEYRAQLAKAEVIQLSATLAETQRQLEDSTQYVAVLEKTWCDAATIAAVFQAGGPLSSVLRLGDCTVRDGMKWLLAERERLEATLAQVRAALAEASNRAHHRASGAAHFDCKHWALVPWDLCNAVECATDRALLTPGEEP